MKKIENNQILELGLVSVCTLGTCSIKYFEGTRTNATYCY